MKVIHAITATRRLWSDLGRNEKTLKVEILEYERRDFGVSTTYHRFLSPNSVLACLYGRDITGFSVTDSGLLIHTKEEKR